MYPTRIPALVLLLLLAAPATARATAEPGDPNVPASISEDDGAPSPRVSRAIFTTARRAHEPEDRVEVLDAASNGSVLFFSEVVGYQGRTVRHRWLYKGRVLSEIPFQVTSQRWRMHSRKTLPPGWVGEWTVVVVDEQDRILERKSFSYVQDPRAVPERLPAASRD